MDIDRRTNSNQIKARAWNAIDDKIIDCQTFVPEFIPVLKALEKQRQMPVPFQDGALLNLCDQRTRVADDGNDYYYEDVEPPQTSAPPRVYRHKL